jgi:Inverse autotransporter, beta-domain
MHRENYMGFKRSQDQSAIRQRLAHLWRRWKMRLSDKWKKIKFGLGFFHRKNMIAIAIVIIILAAAAIAYYSLTRYPIPWIGIWKMKEKFICPAENECEPCSSPTVPPVIISGDCCMPVISKNEPLPICCEIGGNNGAMMFGRFFSKPPKPAPAPSRVPWPKRFTLSHIVGNQGKIDNSINFSSASLLFAPEYRCGQFLPLLDLQGHRFDDTTYAATGGLVLRYIPFIDSNMEEIIGLNAYYDYRQGSRGFYQQVSVGVEILADRWEIRGNGYIPFGNKKSLKVCDGDLDGFRVANHNYRYVTYGFNAEVGGYPVKTPTFLCYIASGPYFISGRLSEPKTVGVEARIRPQFKDYIAVDFSYNWDPLFRSVFQAEIILYAPLYQLSKRKPIGNCARGLTLRQIYQNVERFDVMPLGRRTCRRP